MSGRPAKIERFFLWILVLGGLISLLIYGLSAFLVKPTVETITTHAPTSNSNNKNAVREVNFDHRKPE